MNASRADLMNGKYGEKSDLFAGRNVSRADQMNGMQKEKCNLFSWWIFHVQTWWTACAARGVTYLQYKMFHVQTWWTCIAVRRVAYLQYKMFHVQTWWTAFAVRRVAYLQCKMFHVQTWWTACIEWRVTTAWTRMSPSWSTWPRVVSPSSSRSSERDGWVYFTASQTSTNTCPTSTVAWAVSLYTMTGARTPRLYWYVSISWVVIIMGMFFSHDRSDITVMVDWA